ncbi:MAG: ABC transporter ATP-binding protein [Lachnospiraceae bacterium]|nr:ABC transporter ATP-binding protein [Lachnospiraceae bacterium]
MEANHVVEVKNLVKTYVSGGVQAKVLKGIDLTIRSQDFIAIMGPSGSGKTTLLNLLSTIDKPTAGSIKIDGQDIAHLSNKELSRLRRDKIGFVFQDYNLLDTMTLKDNIALPLVLHGVSGKIALEKTMDLAKLMGLAEHLQKYPYELSGGQKQRGATCRALITEPEIIYADEPTGALDSKAGRDLLECFTLLNERRKTAVLMVTHDPFCASYARDVCMLTDGRMMCRISRGSDRKEFYDRIIDIQASMGGDFPCQW